MISISEKRMERIKRLKLLDDDYAKIFFQNKECIKLVVETILQKSITIVHHETQGEIEVIGDKNVKYDVFVLSNKEGIDVELENKKERVRLWHCCREYCFSISFLGTRKLYMWNGKIAIIT